MIYVQNEMLSRNLLLVFKFLLHCVIFETFKKV